jgi:small subunit ribosomal protein S1
LIHISDFSAEKRINHPGDMLRVGQVVKAQLLALDPQKRQLKLGIKQLVPSGLDEYIAEHKEGDIVTGRMMDASGQEVRVELGEGIHGLCKVKPGGVSVTQESKKEQPAPAADLSSLTSMLQARWKSGPAGDSPKVDSPRTGQVRSFRITRLDPAAKKIEVELA